MTTLEMFPEVPRLDPPPFRYPEQYRCNWCATTYDGDEVRIAFYLDTKSNRLIALRPKCRLCSIEERTNRKSEDIDRDRHKARSTTRHHYHTYRDRGLLDLAAIPNVTRFAQHFGFDYDRMARDIRAALSNACCYCDRPYLERSDVTLDIFDPQRLPYYGVNTRWCCNTCNQAKHDMDPHDFAIWQALWRRRSKRGLMPCQQERMI